MAPEGIARSARPGFPSECVIWPGRLDKDGYPITNVDGRYRTVGRLMYELFVGPVPDGMHILHSCDNPACVNPAHLRPGTPKENSQDMVVRKRSVFGSRSPNAKLTEDEALLIRSGVVSAHQAECAYGLKKSTFYRIRAGQAWRHLA